MSDHRLSSVTLDTATLPAPSAEIDQERRVAVADLLDRNAFQPVGADAGPYALVLSSQDGRLVFDISGPGFARVHGLSMSPLTKVIRDYIAICDSYAETLRGTDVGRIESIDMGRRGLHNEGAEVLQARLAGKVAIDHETGRRLFTLLTALFRR